VFPPAAFEAFESLFAQADKVISCKIEACHLIAYLKKTIATRFCPLLTNFCCVWKVFSQGVYRFVCMFFKQNISTKLNFKNILYYI